MHESPYARLPGDSCPRKNARESVTGRCGPSAAALRRSGLELAAAEAALTKLWIHGGVTIDSGDVVGPGEAHWQPRYEAIRTYRYGQLTRSWTLPSPADAGMARPHRHFGETRRQQTLRPVRCLSAAVIV